MASIINYLSAAVISGSIEYMDTRLKPPVWRYVMPFSGVADTKQRADLIAYLLTLE